MQQQHADLFDLSLANWPGVMLALVPAILNAYIFFYIMFRMPNKAVPRCFGLFTLALIFWQLDDTLARLSNTAATAAAWDNLFSIGWIAMAPLGLYFALLYTGRKKMAYNNLILTALVVPTVFFEAFYSSRIYAHNFEDLGFWGWLNDHSHHIFDTLIVYWIAYQVIIMLVMLSMHAYKLRHNERAKYQAMYIAIGLGIPAIQGVLTQLIMPLIFYTDPIPVTTTFMTCFSVGTAIAFTKYKLFSVYDEVHTETLLESMSDIVFTISSEKKITYVNPYGAMVLGINKGEVDKFFLNDLFPADSQHYEQFLNGVIRPSLRGLRVESFYTTLINKEQQEIAVLITSDPIGDEYSIHGILIVAHNITEMKRAEQSIREKNIELERSNAELETFAFVASHDMKEPLRMVSNYTQLLAYKYEDKLDDEAKEFIHYAVDGVHRMQALINDLLNYSRIGKTNMNFEQVDCNKLMRDVINLFDAEIKQTNAKIYVKPLPVIRGIHSQLEQLFQNLIGNALKFRSEKSPEIHIDVKELDGAWQFSVEDNGIGIDNDYKDKVFVLFQRLHERSKYPGTGIGLTVCKKIAEIHGGRIWTENAPNGGSVFNFTISK